MATKSIRILVKIDFPNGTTTRMWDGSGPYLDADGNVWAGAFLNEGLDQIESAMNAEASTLALSMSGVDRDVAKLAYEDLVNDRVIGGTVQLLIQSCDAWDQPNAAPEVWFTGRIDNLMVENASAGDRVVSQIVVEVTNRFDLRTLVNGAVLSDVDQQARSAIINPGADPDRFAERIPGLADKSIVWPRFS